MNFSLSKPTLYLSTILFGCCVLVSQWHHRIDNRENAFKLESSYYVSKILADKLTAEKQWGNELLIDYNETLTRYAELFRELENQE